MVQHQSITSCDQGTVWPLNKDSDNISAKKRKTSNHLKQSSQFIKYETSDLFYLALITYKTSLYCSR